MSDSNDSTGTMRNTSTESTNYESNGVPEKLWLYEENIKQLYELDKTPDRKTFLDDFFNYRKKNGLYSKIPVIARRPLDVYALYCIVQKYGGFESTMKNRMWSQIARELDLPRTMTSGAFTLKLKYIRLLYQFECHKCNKPVNQAILYNESMIGENKDRYEEHQEEYHMRTTQALHRNEEYDDVIEKEKIYREALRRSTEKEYSASIRQERHDIDALNEPLSMAHPKTSIDDHPLPSSSLSRYNSPDRRVYQTNEMSKEITDMSNKRHLSKSSSYDRDDIFRTFSVDFFEITDDMVTIKVCLNDEKYEGVLKCC